MIAADLSIALPEILLAVFAMAALMFGAFGGKDRVAPLLLWVTAAVFVLLASWIAAEPPGTREAFGGMFIDDAFARFSKVLILGAAAAVLLMGQDYMRGAICCGSSIRCWWRWPCWA
jgi:NADH-quinone oxidoreductase subunit N